MLKTRLLTSFVALPVVLAAMWFGKPWFTILIACWGLLAALEFYRMVAASKASPLTVFGLIWIVLLIISPHFSNVIPAPLLLSSAIVLSLIYMVLRPQKEGTFAGWAWTMSGILYIGWLLSYLVSLQYFDNARGWIFLVMLGTFGCDTFAYSVGKAIGRHRLAPKISPGKTWEGAIGGVVGAIVGTVVMTVAFKISISYAQAIILGVIISIFAQFGDLAESLLKRNTGVKDTGKLLPGHGGLLDRLDSVVFTGVVVYYYVAWIVM